MEKGIVLHSKCNRQCAYPNAKDNVHVIDTFNILAGYTCPVTFPEALVVERWLEFLRFLTFFAFHGGLSASAGSSFSEFSHLSICI